MSQPILEISGIRAGYGAVTALDDVGLRVDDGEMVTLIGANGAGKSTLLNVISGIVPARGGTVSFLGSPLGRRSASRIVASGIVQVPEGRRVFANMTVADNLAMGGYLRSGAEVRRGLDDVYALFPRLAERREQAAGTLSGGEQQMVAIGRALMARPRLLLLDEPSMGLAPIIIREIFGCMARLNREQKVSMLLVEQNARAALAFCRRAYVLTNGRIVKEGTAADLARDPDVQAAFLGGGHEKG